MILPRGKVWSLRMECTRQTLSALLILLVLHCTISAYLGGVFAEQADEPFRIGWLFSDATVRAKRSQRAVLEPRREFEDDGSLRFMNGKCRDKLNHLCGDIDRNNDELLLLECIQTFKVCVELTETNKEWKESSNDCCFQLFTAYRDIRNRSKVSRGNLGLYPKYYRQSKHGEASQEGVRQTVGRTALFQLW